MYLSFQALLNNFLELGPYLQKNAILRCMQYLNCSKNNVGLLSLFYQGATYNLHLKSVFLYFVSYICKQTSV